MRRISVPSKFSIWLFIYDTSYFSFNKFFKKWWRSYIRGLIVWDRSRVAQLVLGQFLIPPLCKLKYFVNPLLSLIKLINYVINYSLITLITQHVNEPSLMCAGHLTLVQWSICTFFGSVIFWQVSYFIKIYANYEYGGGWQLYFNAPKSVLN
jgi:hypothetical protein